MFYRIDGSEYLNGKWTDWDGIGHVLIYQEALKAFRGLSVPKCLRTGKYLNTRSWFTEYGWEKYRGQIMLQIAWHGQSIPVKYRVLTAENLPHVIMKGKTQVVENLD